MGKSPLWDHGSSHCGFLTKRQKRTGLTNARAEAGVDSPQGRSLQNVTTIHHRASRRQRLQSAKLQDKSANFGPKPLGNFHAGVGRALGRQNAAQERTLDSGPSVLITVPTSAGKSWLAVHASHAGTGRFFSRRKAGLYSFDW